jgi:hypothetical protein
LTIEVVTYILHWLVDICVEQLEDLHHFKPAIILTRQFLLFIFLFIIGFVVGTLYIEFDRFKYASYSFTYACLAELKTTLADGCSNLTDLPCSLQMHIDVYFLWTKFVLVYYSLIIIATIYTWHRTVRLSSCIFALYVITVLIFGTDLILYFDPIFAISFYVFILQVLWGSQLEAFMPHNIGDPLSALYERIALSDILNESLLTGHSKRARFYWWAKKMKKEWNIKDEKLIMTAITTPITLIISLIFIACLCSYTSR